MMGAGGPACINLIKILKKEQYSGKIISADCDKYATGFFLSDKYYIVPRSDDENFEKEINKIIVENNIKIIIPTNESSLLFFSKIRDKLYIKKIACLFNDVEVINICNDKWLFYNKIKNITPTPKTSLNRLNIFPQIQKPRKSSGGRGFKKINTEDDFTKDEDIIFQEHLPGMEVTVDCMSDMDCNYLYSVCRERISTKAGISMKGRVFKDKYLENEVEKICNELKIKGPINIQFKKDKSNNWKILEINPRFGGGTIFSYLAGLNISSFLLYITKKYLKYKDNKKPNKNIKEIIVVRYFEEIVI